MKTVFIYTLAHPITEEIRYIGKTKNPKMRFHNHCNKLHNEKTHKRNWINSLKKQGLKPVMEILDEVPEFEWKYWENFWIIQIKSLGFNLVNHSSGGEGSVSGNKTSFKKGSIPFNKGTAVLETRVCKKCNNLFSFKKCLNKNFCSKECRYNYISENPNKGVFKKGQIVWNKNKEGYKLTGQKISIKVEQYTKEGVFIKEFLGCKEASLEMKCISENIRRCCIGKSKTAKGFIWKYKK